MMRLTSIHALWISKFFDLLLWVKLSTIHLYHAWKAIEAFIGFAHRQHDGFSYSKSFLLSLSCLLDRKEKKLVKKITPLRNAFVHYDFGPLTHNELPPNSMPMKVLEGCLERSLSMNLNNYCAFLPEAQCKLIEGLMNLIAFPNYDSASNKI